MKIEFNENLKKENMISYCCKNTWFKVPWILGIWKINTV
jgi:hypothetical protein